MTNVRETMDEIAFLCGFLHSPIIATIRRIRYTVLMAGVKHTHCFLRILGMMLLGCLALTVPLRVDAYTSPEEVLFSEEWLYPPRPDESKARVQAQARRSRVRREREQEEVFARQHPEPPAAPLGRNSVASTEPASINDLLTQLLLQKLLGDEGDGDEENTETAGTVHDTATRWSDLSPETRRLVQRAEARSMELRAVSEETVLQSRTPLADTGAGTVAALLALVGVAGWTLWRARKLDIR